ncbi:MAG TPA: glycosyltransferase family 1 protein [Chloroflexota bacterium]|nr:glycosyltransferase family 1 protein [Chloroflexota bacterium]
MPVTIGFDATSAVRQRAGIGRYTRELLAALARREDPTRYRLIYCSGPDGRLPTLSSRFQARPLPVTDRIANAVWHRARLPIPVQFFTGRIDLFHAPDFTAPPAPRVPTVVTIHDLAFLRRPECAYPTLRAYLEQVVPRAARRATHIIAVSEQTRRDIVELLGVPGEKVTVIPEGLSSLPRLSESEANALVRKVVAGRFILAVGTLEPRKNYPRLLEAYASLRELGWRHRLVIAGARGWMDEPIFEALRALNLTDYVSILRPDDRVLAALYRTADAFIYPSLYEGFGIPPLEALAAGTPTACSATSSLPEVVGDAALTFDPESVDGMTRALDRLLGDRTLSADLRARGPARAARFSWDKTAEATALLYSRLAHA